MNLALLRALLLSVQAAVGAALELLPGDQPAAACQHPMEARRQLAGAMGTPVRFLCTECGETVAVSESGP